MNILQITESLKDLSDQELAGAGAPEYLKQQEISRRLDVRNRYQAQQAQVDATKTVAEKNLEQLMMGGIAGADPMMGQEGDPSMQAGIAGGMGAPPPQGPPMMYGGGILGFQEGDVIEPDPEDEQEAPQLTPEEMLYQAVPGLIESAGSQLAQMDALKAEDYQNWVRTQPSGADLSREAFENRPREYGGMDEATRKILRQAGLRGGGSGVMDVATGYDVARREEYEETEEDRRKRGILLAMQEAGVDNPEYVTYLSTVLDTNKSIDELPSLAQFQETSGYALQAGFPSTAPQTIQQRQAAEEAAVNQAIAAAAEAYANRSPGERAIRDLGLGSVQSLYADAGKRIDDAMKYAMDPENYAAATEARQLAANRALERAEGINTLAQSRMEEQEGLLAQELGLSRERVAELRSEMETPESIEKRRRASLFSALGATLMGDPRELGAGLERTTDKLLDLDEEIATERRTALTGIFDERKAGMQRERAGRGEIYTTESGALTNLTNAQNAFDNEMYNMAQAEADRNVSAYTKAGDQMAALLMDQAKTVAGYMQSTAAMDNELEKMKIQGKNYWVDPTNWPRIDEIIEDTRSAAERFKGVDNERYAKLINTADQMEEMKLGAAIQAGRGVVTSATERTVSTDGLVPLQTGNTSATPS